MSSNEKAANAGSGQPSAKYEEEKGANDASAMLNHAAAAAAAANNDDEDSASSQEHRKTPSVSVHPDEGRPASKVYAFITLCLRIKS
jgi:hypothetical protein